jgi:uncharacterized membrane protein YczE
MKILVSVQDWLLLFVGIILGSVVGFTNIMLVSAIGFLCVALYKQYAENSTLLNASNNSVAA